jgi:hypothetical protein
MDSLEKKLEKADWKQWLPIYGLYQLHQDSKAGKPLAIGMKTKKEAVYLKWSYQTYQSNSIVIGTIGTFYGLAQLLQ